MTSLKDWLGDSFTIEEIEEYHTGPSGVPFGHMHSEWQRLKSSMQSGDELRSFCSPEDWWAHCAGRAGYAVLRGDQVVDQIVTMMN